MTPIHQNDVIDASNILRLYMPRRLFSIWPAPPQTSPSLHLQFPSGLLHSFFFNNNPLTEIRFLFFCRCWYTAARQYHFLFFYRQHLLNSLSLRKYSFTMKVSTSASLAYFLAFQQATATVRCPMTPVTPLHPGCIC